MYNATEIKNRPEKINGKRTRGKGRKNPSAKKMRKMLARAINAPSLSANAFDAALHIHLVDVVVIVVVGFRVVVVVNVDVMFILFSSSVVEHVRGDYPNRSSRTVNHP